MSTPRVQFPHMSQYRSDDGSHIDIDPGTVTHLSALAEVTGKTTDQLLVEAVRMYREHLIPSTKPVVERAKRGKKVSS